MLSKSEAAGECRLSSTAVFQGSELSPVSRLPLGDGFVRRRLLSAGASAGDRLR